jgi:2',3'-cyclic-nucleotide 2'-phosphodiesterase (5'-nucleotidase family)
MPGRPDAPEVGTQANDITRDPNRKAESEMGNMVADALRGKYPEAEAAWTNSGGLRVDFPFASSSAGEGDGVITAGEMFALLPFGNATVIETLTGAQVKASFVNGFSAVCNAAINTGRFHGCRAWSSRTTATARRRSSTASGRLNRPSGTKTPLADGDTLRFVTNDFMLTGGDGYALQPGPSVSSRAT